MVFAIKIHRDWYIASKVKAKTYGPRGVCNRNGGKVHPNAEVWSESHTSALLGIVGEEERVVALEEHSLDRYVVKPADLRHGDSEPHRFFIRDTTTGKLVRGKNQVIRGFKKRKDAELATALLNKEEA